MYLCWIYVTGFSKQKFCVICILLITIYIILILLAVLQCVNKKIIIIILPTFKFLKL